MNKNSLFTRAVVYILLICFILPTHVLYGAVSASEPDKDRKTQFIGQYDKYIKEYTSLDLSDAKDTAKYLVKLSLFIKETSKSGLVYNIVDDVSSDYWSKEINPRWESLLVLQYKLAEYLDLIKAFAGQEAAIAVVSKSQVDYFKAYLETLYKDADDVIAAEPDLTVTKQDNGERAVQYPGVEVSLNTAITNNKILLPTGTCFSESLITAKDNWGTLAGILENYESVKYPTIVSIQLGWDLDEFTKANGYKKMQKYKKAIFQGSRVFLRLKSEAVTKISNLMALQQLEESLYFEALGNALRIYMDNLQIYNSTVDLTKLDEKGIKALAIKACPLIDERKTSSTDYKTAEYARYRCIKKMTVVAKDQIKNIANNPDIYKRQTLKELTEEINTSLIPKIIEARKELAKKIGASESTVTNTIVNFSKDCPEIKGPTQEYFAELNLIVNQYKGARFLYANDDLRDEYFGKPVTASIPQSMSFDTPNTNGQCETSFSKMDETVTEEEVTESFNDSQKSLENYAAELNKAYQNIMDDFLRQKFSTSYNLTNYKLLNDAGLWETTGDATVFDPNGDWATEASKEEDNCLDAITTILKTTPSAAQTAYKNDPKLYDVNGLVNNYLKDLRLSDERAAEFRKYVCIVGVVAGILLTLTFFGSEAGITLIGASTETAATLGTIATTVTEIGTPVFVASMGYETANNIIDNSKYQKMIEDQVKGSNNNEDIDVSFLNTLEEAKAAALTEAIINGFFTALVVAGGIAQIVKTLGFANEQAALDWYAKLAEDMQKDKDLYATYIKLNAKLRVGIDTQNFDLLIRYAQKAGLTTDEIKSVDPSYVNEDLEFLTQPFSKKGLKLFKDWYNRSLTLTQIEAGHKVIAFTLADEGSEIWNAELAKFLSDNPDIKVLLAQTLGSMGSDEAFAFLEGLSEMSPQEAMDVMMGLKKVPMSEKIMNFFKKLKPDFNSMGTFITKIRVLLSGAVNMQATIVDEEITPDILKRFPTFCKAKDWTNKLAGFLNADGTPMGEGALSKYLHVDRDGYLQLNSCNMKQTQCDDFDNYHSVLGPQIIKSLKGSNYDKVAEKWIFAVTKEEGEPMPTGKWFKVKMVTRNFSKQAYDKLLKTENSKGVFKNVKDYYKDDPEGLKKLKFYWLTRIEPTLNQLNVKEPCVQALRTVYDCYDIENDFTGFNTAFKAMRKLVWAPDGYPPGFTGRKIPF